MNRDSLRSGSGAAFEGLPQRAPRNKHKSLLARVDIGRNEVQISLQGLGGCVGDLDFPLIGILVFRCSGVED